MTVIDPTAWRLLALRSALELELKGFKFSRGSVYALIKREFGFKGTKQRVLDQLNEHIAKVLPRGAM